MPREIILRSKQILAELEEKHIGNHENVGQKIQNLNAAETMQLSFFDAKDEQAEKLKKAVSQIDINGLTPIECMLKLLELQKILEDE